MKRGRFSLSAQRADDYRFHALFAAKSERIGASVGGCRARPALSATSLMPAKPRLPVPREARRCSGNPCSIICFDAR
jgi:hypothetical protein